MITAAPYLGIILEEGIDLYSNIDSYYMPSKSAIRWIYIKDRHNVLSKAFKEILKKKERFVLRHLQNVLRRLQE